MTHILYSLVFASLCFLLPHPLYLQRNKLGLSSCTSLGLCKCKRPQKHNFFAKSSRRRLAPITNSCCHQAVAEQKGLAEDLSYVFETANAFICGVTGSVEIFSVILKHPSLHPHPHASQIAFLAAASPSSSWIYSIYSSTLPGISPTIWSFMAPRARATWVVQLPKLRFARTALWDPHLA